MNILDRVKSFNSWFFVRQNLKKNFIEVRNKLFKLVLRNENFTHESFFFE